MIKNFTLNLILISLTVSTLAGNPTECNIDELLDTIEKKTDLSTQTRIANSGISTIYTRDDLNRMQVRYLKDILVSNLLFSFNENRYGFIDPFATGGKEKFISSSIKIYIDNQEITSGISGSGLMIYGMLNIDFVDHIEIYDTDTTYEYTTEQNIVLIKLYTKSVKKDGGGDLRLHYGSRGSLSANMQYADDIDDKWSYFAHATQDKIVRKKYGSVSRDKNIKHFIGTIQSNNHHFLLDISKIDTDAFIGSSLDATPIKNEAALKNIHIGYDGNMDNFYLVSSYAYSNKSNIFEDDKLSREMEISTDTFITDLKYKYYDDKHRFTSGIKAKYKKYSFDKATVNDTISPLVAQNYFTQSIFSIYTEYQYSIEDNLMLSFGLQNTNAYNSDTDKFDKQNDITGRLGVTYLMDNWTFKSIYNHITQPIAPFMLRDASYDLSKIESLYLDTFYTEAIYKMSNQTYDFVAGYIRTKNYLIPEGTSLISTDKNIILKMGLFKWTYEYNKYDKFILSYSFRELFGLAEHTNDIEYNRVVLQSLNTYGDFDIFNEIIYDRDNFFNEDYINYNAGIKYHYLDDLSISLKGENLFDKAVETTYSLFSPDTLDYEGLLRVSSFDRKITLSLEYQF